MRNPAKPVDENNASSIPVPSNPIAIRLPIFFSGAVVWLAIREISRRGRVGLIVVSYGFVVWLLAWRLGKSGDEGLLHYETITYTLATLFLVFPALYWSAVLLPQQIADRRLSHLLASPLTRTGLYLSQWLGWILITQGWMFLLTLLTVLPGYLFLAHPQAYRVQPLVSSPMPATPLQPDRDCELVFGYPALPARSALRGEIYFDSQGTEGISIFSPPGISLRYLQDNGTWTDPEEFVLRGDRPLRFTAPAPPAEQLRLRVRPLNLARNLKVSRTRSYLLLPRAPWWKHVAGMHLILAGKTALLGTSSWMAAAAFSSPVSLLWGITSLFVAECHKFLEQAVDLAREPSSQASAAHDHDHETADEIRNAPLLPKSWMVQLGRTGHYLIRLFPDFSPLDPAWSFFRCGQYPIVLPARQWRVLFLPLLPYFLAFLLLGWLLFSRRGIP